MPENFSFRQKLETAKAAGFDFMEISIDESDRKLSRLNWTETELNGFIDDMQKTQMPVYTMCLSGHRRFPLGSRDSETQKKSFEIMQKAIDFAVKTGIRIIQMAGYDVYYEESGEDTEKNFRENLKKSVEMAAKKGVILAFEIMETPFMNTIEKAMKYVRLINSPYLQVYPDIGNIRNGTDQYLEDIEKGRGHIVAAHLKETVEGVYRDMFFGEGRVDFKGCIEALYGQGVGIYVMEFWYDGKSEPLTYIKKARDFFKMFFP
jgi:L-ribulose-5-phosphate 3-epimerase